MWWVPSGKRLQLANLKMAIESSLIYPFNMVIFHSFCMFARPGLYRKIASGRQLTRWLAENSPSHTSIGISQLGMFDDTEGCFSDVLGGELPTVIVERWERFTPVKKVDCLPPQKSH